MVSSVVVREETNPSAVHPSAGHPSAGHPRPAFPHAFPHALPHRPLIEPVPGRTAALALLDAQSNYQSEEIFALFSVMTGISLRSLIRGNECTVEGFSPEVTRYPSGDFVKVMHLAENRLLLILIDFPGKGVLPSVDRDRGEILYEDCHVAEKVLWLHEFLQSPDAADVDSLSIATLFSRMSLDSLAEYLGDHLTQRFPDDYPAAAFVTIDLRTGEAQYLSRGHTLPIAVIREEKRTRWSEMANCEIASHCELIVAKSPFWGFPGGKAAQFFAMKEGDHLLILSDGFGDSRLGTGLSEFAHYKDAIRESSGMDMEPAFFCTTMGHAPDSLFCPDGRESDPMPRLRRHLDTFTRRDDATALVYTHRNI